MASPPASGSQELGLQASSTMTSIISVSGTLSNVKIGTEVIKIHNWFLQNPPLVQRIWLFARLLLNICELFSKSVALVRIPTATLQCKQSQFGSAPLGIIYQQWLMMLFGAFNIPALPAPLCLRRVCAKPPSWDVDYRTGECPLQQSLHPEDSCP